MGEEGKNRIPCGGCEGKGYFLRFDPPFTTPNDLVIHPNPVHTCTSCKGKGYYEPGEFIKGFTFA